MVLWVNLKTALYEKLKNGIKRFFDFLILFIDLIFKGVKKFPDVVWSLCLSKYVAKIERTVLITKFSKFNVLL